MLTPGPLMAISLLLVNGRLLVLSILCIQVGLRFFRARYVLGCLLCFVTLYKDSVSPGDGDVDSSDGEVSAPGDWPTAGAGHIMLSMWPGVRSSSLCSWTLSSSAIFESVRLMTRPRPRCFHSRL